MVLVIPLHAQKYTFTQYTEGLSNLNVVTLLQDRSGYLWLGTQGGLFRYDSSSFRKFGRAEGFQNTYITNPLEAGEGNLWIGAADGVYFRGTEGKFKPAFFKANRIPVLQGATLVALASGCTGVLTKEGLLTISPSTTDQALHVTLSSAPAGGKEDFYPHGTLCAGRRKLMRWIPQALAETSPQCEEEITVTC